MNDVAARQRRLWTLGDTHKVSDRFAGPLALCDYYKAHFGPLIAVYAGLAGQPDRVAVLDRYLADCAARTNRAAAGEPARYDFDYLLVVGSRA